MKHLLLMISAVFIVLTFSQAAHGQTDLPELDQSHYFIQDHADILSEETIDSLNGLGEHLEEGTGAELLLMTMPTVGQEHRQDYALRVLREYGVGKAEHDNGIVIFLNLDNGNEFNNRGVEIQVGYGVEGYLNDAKIGRIIDDTAMESFQDAAGVNDESTANAYYEEGLENLYNAVYQESLEAYGFVDGEFTREEPADDAGGGELSLLNVITRIIFVMVMIYVLYKIFSNNSGGPGGPGGRNRRTRRRGGPVILFPPSGGGGFGSGGFGGGSGGFGGFGGGSGGGGGAGRGF